MEGMRKLGENLSWSGRGVGRLSGENVGIENLVSEFSCAGQGYKRGRIGPAKFIIAPNQRKQPHPSTQIVLSSPHSLRSIMPESSSLRVPPTTTGPLSTKMTKGPFRKATFFVQTPSTGSSAATTPGVQSRKGSFQSEAQTPPTEQPTKDSLEGDKLSGISSLNPGQLIAQWLENQGHLDRSLADVNSQREASTLGAGELNDHPEGDSDSVNRSDKHSEKESEDEPDKSRLAI